MNVIDTPKVDFGIVDFLMQRVAFNSQDLIRLLIEKFGPPCSYHVSIYLAVHGLDKAIKAFEKQCGESNDEFKNLKKSLLLMKNDISKVFHDHSLLQETSLRNKRKSKHLKAWLLMEHCYDCDVSEDILKYAGAFFCLALGNNNKVSQQVINTLWLFFENGKEWLGERKQQELGRLLNRANQKYGLKEKSFSDHVRSFYFFKNFYASQKERQSVLDWKSMTRSEYVNVTTEIYQNVLEGKSEAIAHALAVVIGLPVNLVMQTPFISANLDEWTVAIDHAQGVVLFDISEIFPGGAKVKNGTQLFSESSGILVKPLPTFLNSALCQLFEDKPEAKNVNELLGDVDENSTSIDAHRLINSTAKFAICVCQIDPYNAALLSSDFRGIASGKIYYKRTTRQSVWAASSHLFKTIGWGEAVEYVDGLSVGSRVVVKDEVVKEIFQNLNNSIEKLRPPNRCGTDRLLEFHDVFCVYSATFTILCMALRNANPIGIQSADFHESNRFIVVDDKHVIGSASAMPVAITDSLAIQLRYWRNHCASLLARLKKVSFTDHEFLVLLEGVVEGRKSPLFIMAEKPYAASVARIAGNWGVPLVENFSRHFWESKFSQIGVSSRFSATQLRHQSSGTLSWAGDSDFVLSNFIKIISDAQENVLRELNINPIHGLSRGRP